MQARGIYTQVSHARGSCGLRDRMRLRLERWCRGWRPWCENADDRKNGDEEEGEAGHEQHAISGELFGGGVAADVHDYSMLEIIIRTPPTTKGSPGWIMPKPKDTSATPKYMRKVFMASSR